MVGRLLAQHRDDGTGHCRVCSSGGQAGRHTWPCRIHEYTRQASEVERRRQLARRSTIT